MQSYTKGGIANNRVLNFPEAESVVQPSLDTVGRYLDGHYDCTATTGSFFIDFRGVSLSYERDFQTAGVNQNSVLISYQQMLVRSRAPRE